MEALSGKNSDFTVCSVNIDGLEKAAKPACGSVLLRWGGSVYTAANTEPLENSVTQFRACDDRIEIDRPCRCFERCSAR
uniref:Uncharacterized protein n=1 Tax=Klebsiella pneumoniae TaxID=573 RepID=A0A2P1BPQ4_KLEPN|nr:hypothetical protein [Klebsiella pneumoniae]